MNEKGPELVNPGRHTCMRCAGGYELNDTSETGTDSYRLAHTKAQQKAAS